MAVRPVNGENLMGKGILAFLIVVGGFALLVKFISMIPNRSTRILVVIFGVIAAIVAVVSGFFTAGPNYTLGVDMMFLGVVAVVVLIVFGLLDALFGIGSKFKK
jgi:hypothetical protein